MLRRPLYPGKRRRAAIAASVRRRHRPLRSGGSFLRLLAVPVAVAALVAVLTPAAAVASGNSFPVVNPASGKCLDIYHSGTADYTNVDLFTCNGGAAQDWHFVPVFTTGLGTVYYIENPNSGKCLDIYHTILANYTNVDLFTCNYGNAQLWVLGSGLIYSYASLLSSQPTMCLDVYHSGTADYTNVDLFTCNGSSAQGWNGYKLPAAPPHGWFACKVALGGNSCLTTTDPINFELYKPGGGAIEAVRQAFVAAGRWGLVDGGCFNPLVHFDAGRGLGQPDDVWATDISNDGCGSGPRNHVRLWEGPGDTVVYGAASFEAPGCGGHCVTDFNGGRNDVQGVLGNYLYNDNIPHTTDDPAMYNSGSLQGVSYDGRVALVQVG